jgi:hypothetical protein
VYFSHLYWLSFDRVSCLVKSSNELMMSRSRNNKSSDKSMKSCVVYETWPQSGAVHVIL